MHVAVMGCVVNGPGESKHSNIGISLPGSGERPVAPVFVDGEKTVTLKGETIALDFQKIVDDYVRSHYGAGGTPGARDAAGGRDATGGAAAAKKSKTFPIKAAV